VARLEQRVFGVCFIGGPFKVITVETSTAIISERECISAAIVCQGRICYKDITQLGPNPNGMKLSSNSLVYQYAMHPRAVVGWPRVGSLAPTEQKFTISSKPM
jgi:hypothetical protein